MIEAIMKIHTTSSSVTFVCGDVAIIGNGEFRASSGKVDGFILYYRVHKKPMIELANGWYHIEILGGETLQDGDYEPTFEFVIQPATNEEATINADMNFSFEITSSAY